MTIFLNEKKRKMQKVADKDNQQKSLHPPCERRIPMVIFLPSSARGYHECQTGPEKKCRRAQSVKKFMELKSNRFLNRRRKERPQNMPLQHQKNDGASVEIDEKMPLPGSRRFHRWITLQDPD
jgi:hypothetical protein